MSPTIATPPQQSAPTGEGFVAGTLPYPWPWDGDLDPARLALVVAGSDHAWIGRSTDVETVASRIDEVATAIRRLGGLTVHVAHDPVAPGHPLAERAPDSGETARGSTVDASADLTVVAGGIDGFFASPLDQRLRRAGRDHLLLAGFGLEGPVHSTLRSANDAGYECLLLTDACASLDPSIRDAAIATVTMSGGIFGAVGTSTALRDALSVLAPRVPEFP